jgi:hypothetical protein
MELFPMYLKGLGKKAKTGISIKEKWLEQKSKRKKILPRGGECPKPYVSHPAYTIVKRLVRQ